MRGFRLEGEAADTAETIQMWDQEVGVEAYTGAALELSSAGGGIPMRVLRALSCLKLDLESSPESSGGKVMGLGRVMGSEGVEAAFREERGSLDSRAFYMLRGALPTDEVGSIVEAAAKIPVETEPDTVDHFPSHHVSLVSGGKLVGDADLAKLVEPLVDKTLLPWVR